MGEEIGWRGFALPRLIERYGFARGAFLLGIVWAVWHYPKLYASPYLHGWSGIEMVAFFSLQLVLANFVICALFEFSGRSVLVAAIFHAAFDTMATIYWQAALDPYVTAVMAGAAVLAVAGIGLKRRRGFPVEGAARPG
jgi:membrane protease YdiL (CAAX protease family)